MPKLYHSNMSGAPVLTGAAGSLLAVLDACLINGFGLVTLDSLTVSGGVATISRAAGMPFEADAVVQLAGITGAYSALNGDRRLLTVGASTATFDATGLPNGTAAGTITAKVSPLGWTKPFSGTNLAVYRSADAASLGMYLRVDDTGTTVARVVGYESMSDANTGTGPFPTTAQVSGGGYWEKSGAAGSTARSWALVCDERAIYYWVQPNAVAPVSSQGVLRGFGDLVARRSTDAYACMLQADAASVVTATASIGDLSDGSRPYSAANVNTLPRASSGLGSAVVAGQYMASRVTHATLAKSGNAARPYPNAADNALDLDPVFITESDLSIRGRLPGLYHSPQQLGFAFASFDRLDGQGTLLGRRLLALRCGSPGYTAQNAASGGYGVVFFDISGGWR